MKKILKTLLLTLIITLLSSNVIYADDTVYTDGYLKYTIDEDGCIKIVEYFGKESTVEIPRAIGLYEKNGEIIPCYVTSIAAGVFVNNKYVEEIKLPDTIVFIEEGAIDNSIKLNYYDSHGNIASEENKPEIIVIPPTENEEEKNKETNESVDILEINEIFEEGDVDLAEGEEEYISDPKQESEEVIDKEVVDNKEEIIDETKPIDVQTSVTINPIGYVLIGLVVVGTVITAVIIRKKKKA